MKERWKEIKGYEGFYEVSSFGRVKSIARKMKHPTKRGFVTIKECILNPYADKGFYLNVNLWISGKSKRFRLHQLVAIAFLGHTPCGHKLVVNHKDFNRQNNHASNLEITTQRKNTDQKHLPSASIFVGVRKAGKKWVAAIHYKRKTHYLGIFHVEEKASEAYQKALKLIENQ